MRRPRWTTLLLPVLLVVVAACSSDDAGGDAESPATTGDVDVTVEPDDPPTSAGTASSTTTTTDAPSTTTTTTEAPTTTTTAPATTSTTAPEREPLAAGDRGPRVEDAQELLNDFVALSDVERGRIVVDGIFGPTTERVVGVFERYAGLEDDGVLSGSDAEALRSTVDELEAGAADSVVSLGSTGELVAFWQDRLDTWLDLTGSDLAPLRADGVFGPDTLEATTAFQEATGLQVDGVVEPEDRVALRDAITALRDAADEQSPSGEASSQDVTLDRFDTDVVLGAGYEAIGCWFRTGGVSDRPIFFTGSDGGLMVVEGEVITLDVRDDAAELEFDGATRFAAPGYTVVFSELGEPVETSIESTERAATLVVSATSGTTSVTGTLWCGV